MSTETGPRCPGCGYPIFGLRDMKCPECGRTLDVRDFALGQGDEEHRRTKLSRDSLIGTSVGAVVLLVILGGVLALTGVFAVQAHVIPLPCVLTLVFVGIVLFWMIRTAGQDARDLWKRKNKRRD